MAGISDILSALQNGVTAINNLSQQVAKFFPTTTATSSTVTAGTITFSSSLASGFMIVQTSSGGTVKIPFYPQ